MSDEFVMIKNNLHKILLILLITPLLFIGINDYHDWGDDFAQYLSQTEDFLSGTNKTKSAVLNYQNFTPNQRGPGFSLFLSPVYYFFGHNIRLLLFLISIIYVVLGVVLYYFFQANYSHKNNKTISLLLVLNFLFNYHILELKMEILPVFPFTLILYSILLLFSFHKNSFFSVLAIGILTGFLISIRSMGWCMYIAILLHQFVGIIQDYDSKKMNQLIVLFFTPIVTLISIKWLVFGNISIENITWYNSVFSWVNLKNIVFHNLQSYLNSIKVFFEQEIWGWANILIRDSVLVLFLIGLARKWHNKLTIIDTFFIIYIGVLLIYPYDKSTFRFLTPILPIILIYVTVGIRSIKLNIRSYYIVSFFLTVLLLSNYVNVKELILNGDRYIVGPENEKATEAFQFIEREIHSNSPIAFSKPSALSYYTKRKSLYITSNNGLKGIENELTKHKVSYVLLCTDSTQEAIFDNRMMGYVNDNLNFEKIWENEQFVLLKYEPHLILRETH